MKKYYTVPSVKVVMMKANKVICASQYSINSGEISDETSEQFTIAAKDRGGVYGNLWE